jgi:uncharacterized protein (DUF697 family)
MPTINKTSGLSRPEKQQKRGVNMSDFKNSWKVYKDIPLTLTVWGGLPVGCRNDIRAEITHASAEVMRVTGDSPMLSPDVKNVQLEMIEKIGSLLGYAVKRSEAVEMLRSWDYYSLDQERIQANGKRFGTHIAEAMGDPISHWWAEEYTRRIGWLAADQLNKKLKEANREAEKKASETEAMKQTADIFRLIARLNKEYPNPGQADDPEFVKLRDEVKTALLHTAANSPEWEALLSAYQRMLNIPTNREETEHQNDEKVEDELDEILRIFS